MLDFAKSKFSESENLCWQEADAGALPFDDGSFDAAVCQFGFMFVPEKGLRNARMSSDPQRNRACSCSTFGTLSR